MKTKLYFACVFSAFFLLTSSLFTGCSSTPSTAAFKSEQATSTTVDAAMTAWGDYVAQYHPPIAQEVKVKAAFEKYQGALVLAIDTTKLMADLAATNSASGGTNAVSSASAQQAVSNAMTQAAGALADLVALIQSFGVKIQ